MLGAIVTSDMLTVQGLAGDLRTAAQRLHIGLHEFRKADLDRDHPRLLTRSMERMSTAKRKKPAFPRREVRFLGSYYLKSPFGS